MTTLISIGLAQALFASLILFTHKKGKTADYILLVWMLVIAANFASILFRFYSSFKSPFDVVFILAHGPFSFLYAKALITDQKGFPKKHLWHFGPFLFFYVIFIFFEISKGSGWLAEFFTMRGEKTSILWSLFSWSIFSIFFVYTYRVQKLLREHKISIKNHFSYESEMINLKWLKVISGLFFIGYLSFMIAGSTNLLFHFPVNPLSFLNVSLILICYSVSFYGFKQPSIFSGKEIDPRYFTEKPKEEVVEKTGKKEENQKYSRSGLKSADEPLLEKKLRLYMLEEKAYLRGDLTIQDIADTIKIPRHYLTQIINENLQQNFYSFVNDYRLEEVKKRLIDPQYKNLTILAIAYDCGFNSKSTFNTYFKNHTELTPTQYRKQNIKPEDFA